MTKAGVQLRVLIDGNSPNSDLVYCIIVFSVKPLGSLRSEAISFRTFATVPVFFMEGTQIKGRDMLKSLIDTDNSLQFVCIFWFARGPLKIPGFMDPWITSFRFIVVHRESARDMTFWNNKYFLLFGESFQKAK